MPLVRSWIAVAALLTGYAAFAQQTLLTVTNECNSTIWPAMLPIMTNQSFGWEADAGSTRTISLPSAWQGYIWGRTGCDFQSDASGNCQTGGCDALECNPDGVVLGTGPFSRGILLLNQSGQDIYSVQLDTGFNLPMAISSNTSCVPVGCAADLNANCPQAVKVTSKGATVGCMTSCEAQIAPVDQNCCQGQFESPQACNTSDIQYYDYFHGACPQSHVSFFDSTGEKLCPSAGDGLVVTFCPDPSILIAKPSTSSTLPGIPFAPGSTATGNPNGSSPPGSGSTGSGSPGSGSTGPSLGLIIGVIVGAVAVVALVAVGVFLTCRRKSRLRQRGASLADAAEAEQPGGYNPLLAAHVASPPSSHASDRISMMYEAGGKRILQASNPADVGSASTPQPGAGLASAQSRGQPPVDMQRIFENRELTSDLLRFIAQRMDTGPTDGADELDPPEYHEVLR